MNILNAIVLFLIAVYIAQGFHKGFLVSVGNTLGLVVSWIISIIFSPLLSKAIYEGDFYSFLLNLTEGSSRLADQSEGSLVVSSLSQSKVHMLVSDSAQNLPMPFADLIEDNMNNLAFQQDGFSTVNDYFNYTVADVVVNIFAFLIIYAITRVIIALLINAVNFASPLPVLRRFDGCAGGAVGFLRGFLEMFAFAMLIPVMLISMPVGGDILSDMLADSSIVTWFYQNDFLLNLISGVI